MRILNLYAGIGGNRKLWGNEHGVTAVESEQYIADVYKKLFPYDTVIVADAHQYLLDHHKEFDFVWSSPPCSTHSRVSHGLTGWGVYRYLDMTLYQEILFLKHFFKGRWLVENVIAYYEPLITPRTTFDRHYWWSNFHIPRLTHGRQFKGAVTDARIGELAKAYGLELPQGTKNKRKLLRNAVDPKLGLHILTAAQTTVEQTELIEGALKK